MRSRLATKSSSSISREKRVWEENLRKTKEKRSEEARSRNLPVPTWGKRLRHKMPVSLRGGQLLSWVGRGSVRRPPCATANFSATKKINAWMDGGREGGRELRDSARHLLSDLSRNGAELVLRKRAASKLRALTRASAAQVCAPRRVCPTPLSSSCSSPLASFWPFGRARFVRFAEVHPNPF